VLVFLGTVAYGQGAASIVGTVEDPTGAVVPNAKIAITNMDNGFVRTTTSDSAGSYKAPELPAGKYALKAEASDFKTYERTAITLNLNDTVRVDASHQIGDSPTKALTFSRYRQRLTGMLSNAWPRRGAKRQQS
jgi:Carboxypeptidase regulatory-like domain